MLFALVALGAAWCYAAFDGEPLFWDEYYHLLAARSWAVHGTFAVGDGVYERAAWLSIAVGWVFRTFGESIVLAMGAFGLVTAIWALAVFAWVRHQAGTVAAWSAGLLFALSPIVLINSGMVRFYGVVGLLTTGAAIAAFAAVDRPRKARTAAALLAAAALCLLVADRITSLTRLWAAGLGVWLAIVGIARMWARGRRVGVALVIAAGFLALAALWHNGTVGAYWRFYRETPLWGRDRGSDLLWYEGLFRQDYPAFWTLLPLAGVLAYLRRPGLAGLCASLFVTGFALLSGAGPKSERYLVVIIPYYFVLWGVASAELAPTVRTWVSRFIGRILGPSASRPFSFIVSAAVWVAIGGFVVGTNPGLSRIRGLASGHLVSQDRPVQGQGASPRAWEELAPMLRAVMDSVDVVVTANSIQTLYHVGSYDYAMRPTVVAELQPPEEFVVDPRTGRPAISTLESLRKVIAGSRSGIVFGERTRWGSSTEGFTPDVVAFIRSSLQRVPLPPRLGVVAYRWGPDGHP